MNDVSKACSCPSGDGSLRHPCPAHSPRADVQPGGRVRLATVPYDRARDLLGDAYNAGTHGIGYSQQTMELHEAIIPARPSPGGQGAPRCAEHCQNGFADICLASQRDGVICPEDSCDIDDGIRHNHLAAHQSAGEPVAFMVRWKAAGGYGLEWPKDMQYFRDRADEYEIVPLHLAASQPVAGLSWADYWVERGQSDVAHDFEAFSRAEAWALQRFPGAHQQVGSLPEWFELVIRDVCELDPQEPDAADTVCIRLLDLRLMMERHALPAQAVDLGQFRWAVLAAIDKFTGSPADATAAAKMDQLLALIDSQAVANG